MPGPLSEHGELFQRRTPPTSLPPRLHRFVMAAPTSSGYSSFPFAPWPAFQAIYSDPPASLAGLHDVHPSPQRADRKGKRGYGRMALGIM